MLIYIDYGHFSCKRRILALWKLRGKGGVPEVHIMENEFECLADRGDQDLAVAEEFVKKYCS